MTTPPSSSGEEGGSSRRARRALRACRADDSARLDRARFDPCAREIEPLVLASRGNGGPTCRAAQVVRAFPGPDPGRRSCLGRTGIRRRRWIQQTRTPRASRLPRRRFARLDRARFDPCAREIEPLVLASRGNGGPTCRAAQVVRAFPGPDPGPRSCLGRTGIRRRTWIQQTRTPRASRLPRRRFARLDRARFDPCAPEIEPLVLASRGNGGPTCRAAEVVRAFPGPDPGPRSCLGRTGIRRRRWIQQTRTPRASRLPRRRFARLERVRFDPCAREIEPLVLASRGNGGPTCRAAEVVGAFPGPDPGRRSCLGRTGIRRRRWIQQTRTPRASRLPRRRFARLDRARFDPCAREIEPLVLASRGNGGPTCRAAEVVRAFGTTVSPLTAFCYPRPPHAGRDHLYRRGVSRRSGTGRGRDGSGRG